MTRRRHTTGPSLFDGHRAPRPVWRQQGNPVFESRKPLPLEAVAESRATEDELVQRARDAAAEDEA